MSWIKINTKEDLPDTDREVLIAISGEVVQAYYRDGYWKGSILVTEYMREGYVEDRIICKQGEHFDYVTHWMELPKHP